MPKALLEFNLADSDDVLSFEAAVQGQKYHSVLWGLTEWLRSRIKYCDGTPEEEKAFETTREELYRLMDEYGAEFLE